MAEVQYRAAEPGDESGILELGRDALGWGSDPRYVDLYRWKHQTNVFGPSPAWVAVDGNRIVGFRTMMRWRFRHPQDGTIDAVRAVDTATAPSHQGLGIFRRLTEMAVEQLVDDGVGFVFNTPNEQSRPGYLKMGWVELGQPTIAFRPRLRSLHRIAGARAAAELWSVASPIGEPAGSFFADADERWAGLWAPSPRGWSVDRSIEWCRWRYGLPDLGYRVLTAEHLGVDGEPSALVFRMRRRGGCMEAAVVQATAAGRARRALFAALLKQADYALVCASSRVDSTPAVALRSLSPRMTWRDLSYSGPIPLDAFRFELADLELF